MGGLRSKVGGSEIGRVCRGSERAIILVGRLWLWLDGRPDVRVHLHSWHFRWDVWEGGFCFGGIIIDKGGVDVVVVVPVKFYIYIVAVGETEATGDCLAFLLSSGLSNCLRLIILFVSRQKNF